MYLCRAGRKESSGTGLGSPKMSDSLMKNQSVKRLTENLYEFNLG